MVRREFERLRRERRARRRTAVASGAVVIGALAAIPLVSASAFNLGRYDVAVAYVMAAMGLNLAFGFAGELAIGYSAIMAAGAYSAGMLNALAGWNALLVVPVSVAAGVGFGLLTMLPGLRVRGWYLALITMFSVLVVPQVVILGEAWTGGEYGLTGVTAIQVLGYRFGDAATLEFTVACFAAVWVGTANFVRSSWGYRVRALRDARNAAEAVGISLNLVRFVVYLLSAVPAALAGVLLAYSQRVVNADAFNMSLTLLLLTGVVLGGAGTVWGPVIGMAPLVALSFWVGPFSQYNAIALGFALMVGVLVFMDGVVPAIAAVAQRVLARDDAPPDRVSALDEVIARGAAASPDTPTTAHTGTVAGATPDYVVRARGVAKRFGGLVALEEVELDLPRGRLCGLVGPNGSGKSTFLNVLSGFITPDSGEVRVAGTDTAGRKPYEIARMGVGRTFQVPQLVDELTALENIQIGLLGTEPGRLLPSLLSTPAVRRRAHERHEHALATLDLVGLPPASVRTPVEILPLGLKRTVEVARAVVSRPNLLLLDEPAAGLNDEERVQLGQLLVRLKHAGITILVVEHNVRFITDICDDIVLLESGRVTARADLHGPLPERLVSYLKYAPDRHMAPDPAAPSR